MMKYAAAVLDAGIPLPAFLQLMRVYGQVMAQIADAEVRLIHLYVHEPLIARGRAQRGDSRADGGAHALGAAVCGAR